MKFVMGAWSSASPFHSIYHELGHAVYYMMTDGKPSTKNKIDTLYFSKYSDILGSETKWVTDVDTAKELASKAKEVGFSYYGLRNPKDFVAEAFAQYYCSEAPCEITTEVIRLLLEG